MAEIKEERQDVSFVMVSSEFLHCMRYLSPQSTSLWIALLRYWHFKKGNKEKRVNEYVFPSKKALQLRTGLSKNTVLKCIKELQILGFIKKIEQRFSDENRAWKSNYYFLDDHPTITQEKLDKLVVFRNLKRAQIPPSQDEIEYELYGD